MLHRPDFGFNDEGQDLSSGEFYAGALGEFGQARVLPPAAFRSLRFSLLEDETIWTRDWICIGSEDEIPNDKDMLPFTVGNHGVHVQRIGDALTGRFNKAQHGGCRAIPLQCQTGKKTKCSFTSCGYSRDRGAILAGELGDDTPAMEQYLGVQPDRLFPVHVASLGGLVFVNLDFQPASMDESFSGLEAAVPFFDNDTTWRAAGWLEFDANWKLLGQHLAAGAPEREGEDAAWLLSSSEIDGQPAQIAWLFPNLILMRGRDETCAVVLQQTALGQTLCRTFVSGDEAPSVWTKEIERRAAGAVAEHHDAVRWGTHFRPETMGADLPLQAAPQGLWMQRMLARRASETPNEAFPQPIYQNARG